MSEPEIALAFTADPWVEDLHRHLTNHGGARVRVVVVDGSIALDESYDVLVTGHRWPALTHAFVADLHARRRAILGVFDREEPASRSHLLALGVDSVVESDAAPEAFVRAIGICADRPDDTDGPTSPLIATRAGRLIAIGGAPGVGRSEVAIQLAVVLGAGASTGGVVLVDADDVAPALAQRLRLPIEPNLRGAIDAVEHGRGALAECLVRERNFGFLAVTGAPNPAAWAQVRPGEVLRVVDQLAWESGIVVADLGGQLDDLVAAHNRSRYATARALVQEADGIVAVCDTSPHGVARLFAWVVEARRLAPDTPIAVVVNRAPAARFRRHELFAEIAATTNAVAIAFAAFDPKVSDAAWEGRLVARGPFTKGVEPLGAAVDAMPRRFAEPVAFEAAS